MGKERFWRTGQGPHGQKCLFGQGSGRDQEGGPVKEKLSLLSAFSHDCCEDWVLPAWERWCW